MEVFLTKRPDGALAPNTEEDVWELGKIKTGQTVRVTLKRVRNYPFLQKYMVMVKFAFDHFDPPHNEVAVKDFDRFRQELQIQAGYYDMVLNIDGTTHLKPKSVSFDKMDEDEFERLYNAVAEVIRQRIFNDLPPDEMDEMLDKLESFHG